MSGYSQAIMEGLINDNPFFNKSEEERYEIFKDVDPFPNVSASLLNSADVIKYILTTGMIESFDIKNLSGATYACEFSGEYMFWDNEKIQNASTLIDDKVQNEATFKDDNSKVQNKIMLNKDKDELRIEPNSITFIAVKQYFRIPSYIVLRFNLNVSHVYKGLLLGTGPIVDPRFAGQLFIPLHNLTSNSYIIKKNALIISVEFTKMSKNPSWNINTKREQKSIVENLIFDSIEYKYDKITSGRSLQAYIDKALSNDPLFFKHRPDRRYINSSLPEKIHEFEEEIKRFGERFRDNKDQMDKDSRRMEKTETYVKSFTFIAFLSVFVACVALSWTAYSFLKNSSKLSDAQKTIETQQQMYDTVKKDYDAIISDYKTRIEGLEKRLKASKIP